ncbi:hypothetical protein OSK93_24240, partial [Escherichia coli]|nr:hypothetical protein [Escherichia coli]
NVFAVYAPQYYATAKDAAYHMYLKNLSGQLTEETLEQVENEKRRLEQLQEPSRKSAEMSGTGLEALAGAYGKTDWKDG